MTATHAPAVVAVGGGHGLATSLRAIRMYAGSISAVVSVADDGGSSGRLRAALGVPAPGDIRRCVGALVGEPSVLAASLDHRFSGGELDGHALGNVLLAGLADATGDFTSAVDELARLVNAVGTVIPATVEPVVLVGDGVHGRVAGQVAIKQTGVDHLALDPAAPSSPPAVSKVIEAADQVILGPGSLYTSVLAAAVVPAVREALRATSAQRVYVCNLGPEGRETAGLDAAAHVEALERHGIDVDVVVHHPTALPGRPIPVPVVERPVARLPDGLAHDPVRLGEVLGDLASGVLQGNRATY
ncbi:MAG TPA: uridine diphosphate-N-acetylglucosamine-binding protein YvcK [Acidimicrobiales bacterium]|nr:uridine diphosphate-N-acetylglucosamine-binding protein YvcK [Acidimicrobiales bacterium]